MRIKALWIAGKIGENFHDLKGVWREAERQGRKVLKSQRRIHVLDIMPKPEFEGFYVLITDGSSGSSVEEGRKK